MAALALTASGQASSAGNIAIGSTVALAASGAALSFGRAPPSLPNFRLVGKGQAISRGAVLLKSVRTQPNFRTSIPLPKVPIMDQESGQMSPAWYEFFLALGKKAQQ